jgi:hypothetical protein
MQPSSRSARRAGAAVVDTTRSPHARLRPVPLDAVTLTDTFWAPRIETNRATTIPGQHRLLAETGRLENFKRVAGQSDKPFDGIYFNDSDVYKWLEAASWSLAAHPDPELDKLCDDVIELIGSAQDDDGYLDTYFCLERRNERWSNLKDLHELYCAGHYIQAAVAHHRATGKESALKIACRLADCIGSVFGDAPGQRRQTDGHEEIEMALVELSRETGEKRYLETARFLVDVRGEGTIGGGEYHQDHLPFERMSEMAGHAVRAAYYTCGVADLVMETGESAWMSSLERLWNNMTERRMYVTGGIGSRWEGEAFGKDYELPNERAYTETCAAIASVMWNYRMLLMTGDARYADLMEHTLLNAVLPGLSLDGASYFYQNPLADDGGHRRQEWFGCACCPPNVARMLASLSGYFYSVSDNAVWTHLYASGEARIELDKSEIRLRQATQYPWDGRVVIDVAVEEPTEFSLKLRIPSWAVGARFRVNDGEYIATGQAVYVAVGRRWHGGDRVELDLPMPIRTIRSHPYVLENTGRVALARGPLVYAFEAADNPDVDLRSIELTRESELVARFDPALLGGIGLIRVNPVGSTAEAGWEAALYRDGAGAVHRIDSNQPRAAVAIPYFAWANREPGQMQVWIRARW